MDGRMTAEHIVKDLLLNKGSNTTTITVGVNAGGVGVWIAVTCCLVTLAMVIPGLFWVSHELQRQDARAAEQQIGIDRANTFLAAIWAQAPELEKRVKNEDSKDAK